MYKSLVFASALLALIAVVSAGVFPEGQIRDFGNGATQEAAEVAKEHLNSAIYRFHGEREATYDSVKRLLGEKFGGYWGSVTMPKDLEYIDIDLSNSRFVRFFKQN